MNSYSRREAVKSINLKKARQIRIMVFGDSNTFRPEGSNTCWTSHLQDNDPAHLDIINEGFDGRTTTYDRGEHNGLSIIRKKLVIHEPLDYIIVMLGTNDLKSRYGLPSITDIADGMRRILDVIEIHGGGALPILVTPPPLGKVISGELTGARKWIQPLTTEYCLLAMNRNIRLVDLSTIINYSIDLEPDNVHLNAVGRRKVADAVWANLQALILPRPDEELSGT